MAEDKQAATDTATPSVEAVEDFDDLDDHTGEVIRELHQMLDEVDCNEPLQAKQTFALIKAHMDAMEAYINGL